MPAATTITPHTIPGPPAPENQGAVAWGSQNLVAYGSHSLVVVLDVNSTQIVQTLDSHDSPVCLIRWCPDPYPVTLLEESFHVKVVSVDTSGRVVLWDVATAEPIMSFVGSSPTGNRQVVDLQWLPSREDMIITAHPDHTLCMWKLNMFERSATRLWRRDVLEIQGRQARIRGVAFDPFNRAVAYVTCTDGAVFPIHDIEDKGVIVRSPFVIPAHSSGNDVETVATVMSPHHRGIMFRLLQSEIVIFDDSVRQTIGAVSLKAVNSPATALLFARDDARLLFTFHADGTFVVWVTKSGLPDDARLAQGSGQSPGGASVISNFSVSSGAASNDYEIACVWDTIRVTTLRQRTTDSTTHLGIAICPLFGAKFVTALTDGTVWVFQLPPQDESIAKVSICRAGGCVTLCDPTSVGLSAFFKYMTTPLTSVALSAGLCRPALGVTHVGVGNGKGTIQVFDIRSSELVSEYSIRPGAPVYGIAWIAPGRLIAYTFERTESGRYKNFVFTLDTSNGRVTPVRKLNEDEPTYVRGLKVSPSADYVVVLLKESPFEMWNLSTRCLMRTFQPFPVVSALEWWPRDAGSASLMGMSPTSLQQEFLVFTTLDGTLHHYAVHNGIITPQPKSSPEFGGGTVTALAGRGKYLVSGDNVGTLLIFDFNTNKTQTFVTQRGSVRRIRFSPGNNNNHLVIVLFSDGNYGIWDVDHGSMISQSAKSTNRQLKAQSVDWYNDTHPIITTSDGAIRVLDISLSYSNSPFLLRSMFSPISTPWLLPQSVILHLRAVLQLGVIEKHRTRKYSLEDALALPPRSDTTMFDSKLMCYGDYMPERLADTSTFLDVCERFVSLSAQYLHSSLLSTRKIDDLRPGDNIRQDPRFTTASRCLHTAAFFGDVSEVELWQLVVYYLRIAASNKSKKALSTGPESPVPSSGAPPSPGTPKSPPLVTGAKVLEMTRRQDSNDREAIVSPRHVSERSPEAAAVESDACATPGLAMNAGALPERMSLLGSAGAVRRNLIERATSHASVPREYQLTQTAVAQYIQIGQTRKALDLLLETPVDHVNFHRDGLKACLLAQTISQADYKRTIGWVGSNLIAKGQVDEGIQLLCMASLYEEACRSLQTHGQWIAAAQLAKSKLAGKDAELVYRRWAEHMLSIGDRMGCAKVYVTLRDWSRCATILQESGRKDIAALLCLACEEAGVTVAAMDSERQQLAQVYFDYGNYLFEVGYKAVAKEFVTRAGALAEEVRKKQANTIPSIPPPS